VRLRHRQRQRINTEVAEEKRRKSRERRDYRREAENAEKINFIENHRTAKAAQFDETEPAATNSTTKSTAPS